MVGNPVWAKIWLYWSKFSFFSNFESRATKCFGSYFSESWCGWQQSIGQGMVTSKIETKYDYKLSGDLGKDEMHDWMHKLERHIMNREVNEHVSRNDIPRLLIWCNRTRITTIIKMFSTVNMIWTTMVSLLKMN